MTRPTIRMIVHSRKVKRAFALYGASALIYAAAIVLIHLIPFYQSFLGASAMRTIHLLYTGYLLLAPFYYAYAAKEDSVNKPYLILRYVRRLIAERKWAPAPEEKTAVLFIMVKLFFLPLMVEFFYENIGGVIRGIRAINYAFALALIFTLDTFIFALGYTFEFSSLRNVVRSVEPTVFGWAVALASYPPFNGMVGKYVPWGANEYAFFWNDTYTAIARVVMILLLGIYLCATFALGPKASNLTNRGIVTRFPYSVVRHPAYVSKNAVWWISMLPVMSWIFAGGMLIWSTIYFFRAVTEERHLMHDEEYRAYCRKVKYRFIPFVW